MFNEKTREELLTRILNDMQAEKSKNIINFEEGGYKFTVFFDVLGFIGWPICRLSMSISDLNKGVIECYVSNSLNFNIDSWLLTENSEWFPLIEKWREMKKEENSDTLITIGKEYQKIGIKMIEAANQESHDRILKYIETGK